MKKIQDLKNRILIENGYGKGGDVVSAENFKYINEEAKKKYVNCDDGLYRKPAEVPNLTDDEIMLIMAEANYKNIKTIKNCVVFFAVLAVISLILSILASCALTA